MAIPFPTIDPITLGPSAENDTLHRYKMVCPWSHEAGVTVRDCTGWSWELPVGFHQDIICENVILDHPLLCLLHANLHTP